jgi:hypothetical protein
VNNEPQTTITEVTTPVETTPAATLPTTVPTGTPQQQDRAAIYERFYASQPTTTTTSAAPETPPAEPAPVEPTTVVPTTPPTPSAPDPDQLRNIVNEVIKSLMPAPKPAAPAPTTPAPVVDPTAWVSQLTSGDFKGATETLQAQILASVQSQLAPQLQQQTMTEAVENFKAETALNEFVSSIRAANADIIKLEPLIAPKIQLQMQEWLQSQSEKVAPLAYVEHYKTVANKEINEARSLIQQFRAAGAGSQQTVKQEVLSSTTLSPTPIQAPQVPTGQPNLQSVTDYLTQRQNMTNMRNGMRLRN